MPRIMPEARYFSMPSVDVGAELRRKRALNCCPWVRSLIHSPDAVIHSPAAMVAAWPTMVTMSRCPRALARSTPLVADRCSFAGLADKVIAPAEGKMNALQERRRVIE